jgi:signal transduction histidine kinase
LEPSTLKLAGLSDYYKNIIKPNAGVRIYRDNFRVWPYGEPQDDWLGLDLKRLNEPKERLVSRNQVIGIIHISSTLNKDLKDQSNREGLISNEQYDTFFHLVNASLSVFAKERKKDKIKIDKIGKSKSNKDIVTESIDRLRENITQRGHDIFYENDINKIEASYHEKINDVLERYMMAAAIGISYSIPIHEMKLRLTSIKHLVDDLQDHPELQDKFLKQLSEYVQETQDIVKAVTSIMSKQQTKQVMLWTIAENTQILKQSELKKHNILYNITGDKTISVEAVPGLLSTAVLNVVDNAIFWLRAKRLKSRSEKIEFVPRIDISITKNAAGNPVMKISDNGTGFEDPFEYLLEPYYSTKTDGLGLGLFLVKEIMTRLAGRVNGYNENGAVFELIFKKAEHEKN